MFSKKEIIYILVCAFVIFPAIRLMTIDNPNLNSDAVEQVFFTTTVVGWFFIFKFYNVK